MIQQAKSRKALQRIDELDEHERKLRTIDAEIAGVRRLIGNTEEYQDLRVLISAVDEIRRIT